jgi:hypothetical protein
MPNIDTVIIQSNETIISDFIVDKLSIVVEEQDSQNNNKPTNIFRYKFMEEFTKEVFQFSKIHQYDGKHDFKEAWQIWVEENNSLVVEQEQLLITLGYKGNIPDKMFKSARYYFRKKSTVKKEPIKRGVYHSVRKEFLEAIDAHITSSINLNNPKPSERFDDFCKSNIDILKEEVIILCQNGFSNSNEIKKKISKTYKNRYFLSMSKNT